MLIISGCFEPRLRSDLIPGYPFVFPTPIQKSKLPCYAAVNSEKKRKEKKKNRVSGLDPTISVVHAWLVEAGEGLRCSHRLLVEVVVVKKERLVKKVHSVLGWLLGNGETGGMRHGRHFLGGAQLNMFVDLASIGRTIVLFVVGW